MNYLILAVLLVIMLFAWKQFFARHNTRKNGRSK